MADLNPDEKKVLKIMLKVELEARIIAWHLQLKTQRYP